jgi:hypothetical protein
MIVFLVLFCPRRRARFPGLPMKISFPSVPVANCDERPGGESLPSLVVVHAISLPPDRFGGAGVEQLFTNRLDPAGHPSTRRSIICAVSAHYFIRRDGELVCFVPPRSGPGTPASRGGARALQRFLRRDRAGRL